MTEISAGRKSHWYQTSKWPHSEVHQQGASLVVQWLSIHAPNTGGLGSIPSQGTRSCMPQLRSHVLQLRPGTAK